MPLHTSAQWFYDGEKFCAPRSVNKFCHEINTPKPKKKYTDHVIQDLS